MGLSFRIVVVVVVLVAIAAAAAPAPAGELATAQGAIAITEARLGLRAPLCSELVVEARDALDNRLIAETRPTMDETGTCRYVLTVPAQMAVSLRLQPILVAGARVINGASVNIARPERPRAAGGSVGLRFTIVAASTYFFAPAENKSVPLSY